MLGVIRNGEGQVGGEGVVLGKRSSVPEANPFLLHSLRGCLNIQGLIFMAIKNVYV